MSFRMANLIQNPFFALRAIARRCPVCVPSPPLGNFPPLPLLSEKAPPGAGASGSREGQARQAGRHTLRYVALRYVTLRYAMLRGDAWKKRRVTRVGTPFLSMRPELRGRHARRGGSLFMRSERIKIPALVLPSIQILFMHPDPLAHPDLPSRSSTDVPHRDRFHAPPSPRFACARRLGRGSRTFSRPGQGRYARQGVLKNEKRKLRCASGRSPKGEARETAREARAEPAITMPPPEDVFLMREREAPQDLDASLAPGAFFAAFFLRGFPCGALLARDARYMSFSPHSHYPFLFFFLS